MILYPYTLKHNVANHATELIMLAFVTVVSRVNESRGEASTSDRACEGAELCSSGFLGKILTLLLWFLAEATRWVRQLDAQKICVLIAAALCWTLLLDERERMMMLCGALGYLAFKPLAKRPHMATLTCL